jgi:hypothetical protein
VTNKPTLSNAWRRNHSSIRAIELASSIRSLRKVVGTLTDDDECIVNYNAKAGAGSFNAAGKEIRIDPEYAVKSTPISDSDFDVLTGLTVHEAMHSVCDSKSIRSDNQKAARGTVTPESLAVVGEEIYCDGYASRHYKTPGKYIRAARNAYTIDPEKIKWSNVINAWIATSVYRHLPPDNIPDRTLNLLSHLLPYTSKLRKEDMTIHERNSLYNNIYRSLEKAGLAHDAKQSEQDKELGTDRVTPGVEVGDWTDTLGHTPLGESDDSNSDGDSDEDSDDGDDATGGTDGSLSNDGAKSADSLLPMHSQAELSDELSTEVAKALDENVEDITQELIDILQRAEDLDILPQSVNDRKANTKVSPSDLVLDNSRAVVIGNAPVENGIVTDVDADLLKELQWMDRVKNSVGREIVRFEERGRVDRSTLYRAKIDRKVFRSSRTRNESDMEAVMLLDASASMGRRTNIYEAAYAIHRVLPRVPLYSFDRSKDTRIYRNVIGGDLRKVEPGGNTPTGLALLSILKDYPEALVILFSDGECNSGITEFKVFSMLYALFPKAKVLYIRYVGIGEEYLEDYDDPSDQVQVITTSNLKEVPGIMRDALRPWFRMS